jgi:citrate synthase
MIKTQVQIPDHLYYTAKAIAEQREWSFAEVIRRGLEHRARIPGYGHRVRMETARPEKRCIRREF